MDQLSPRKRQQKTRPVMLNGDGAASIALTRGLTAIIDAADVALVDGHNWGVMDDRRGHQYAIADVKDANGHARHFYLHKVILGVSSAVKVDHADRNTLNNRRSNLRVATNSQNAANSAPRSPTGSIGVWYDPKRRKFVARLGVNGKVKILGRFTSRDEAARVRDRAAVAAFGPFAILNYGVA